MSTSTALATRYGVRSSRRRWALYVGSAVVVSIFLGWLVWVIWLTADPEVTSQLQSFEVTDDHSVSAIVQVHLADPQVQASCMVTALAADHTVVGERTFAPSTAATQQIVIRTDRRATSAESSGCTAPGQDRAH